METPSADQLLAQLENAPPPSGESPAPVAVEQTSTEVGPLPEGPLAPIADAEPAPAAKADEPAAPAADTPAAPAAEAEAQANPAQPEPEAPKAEDVIDPEEASGRFRLKGKAAALAMLVKSGVPEEEAAKRIYGEALAKAEAQHETPAEPAEDPVAKLETALAEVRARQDARAEEGAVVDKDFLADNRLEAQLERELEQAKAAKVAHEQRAQQEREQQADTEFDRAWTSEIEEVVGIYGDTAKDDGALGKAMLNEFEEAGKNPQHKLHRHYNAGTLTPLVMAPYVAAKLKIAPAGAQPAAPAAPAAPTPPAPAQRVLPVPGGARPAAPPVSNQAIVESERRQRLAAAAASGNAEDMASIFSEATGGSSRGSYGFRLA